LHFKEEFMTAGRFPVSPPMARPELRIAHAVALGRLQIEPFEVLSYAYGLGIDCRRYTADYVAREGG
jgi:hypothetical protein